MSPDRKSKKTAMGTDSDFLLSVLVVDDERAVRDGLARWLTKRQCHVRTAADLSAAMEAVRGGLPEVILLDVKLGREDGLRLLFLLHDEGLDIPCVIFTAHSGPDDGFRAREMGAVDLIKKPSTPDAIVAALKKVVERRRVTARRQSNDGVKQFDDRVGLGVGSTRKRLQAAIARMESDFGDSKLSVGRISGELSVSQEHLSRVFQSELGRSPLRVLNEIRTARADELSKDARLNLTEVANACGYQTTRQLNHWFSLILGRRPRGDTSKIRPRSGIKKWKKKSRNRH